MPDNDPDFVGEVGEIIEYITAERGLPTTEGQAVASAVTTLIREIYKGERVSIRSRKCRKQIADQVKAEFDGSNMAELIERFEISRATFYRIIGDSD